MKLHLSLRVFAATAALCLCMGAVAQCPSAQPSSLMVQTFSDDFHAGVAPWKWTFYAGQHGQLDQEAEAYVPAAVQAVPGVGMRIVTDRQQQWGHSFTSGWASTQGHFAQAYGHFEVYARLPAVNGVLPAFWMAPENGTWPPEIDVFEYEFAPNGDPKQGAIAQATLHYPDVNNADIFVHPGHGSALPAVKVVPDDQYHLYAIDWRPQSLVWLIDNKPVFCIAGSAVPSMPMYMIIGASVAPAAGNWFGSVQAGQAWPVNYDIGYVHAYQFRDVKGPVLPLDMLGVSAMGQESGNANILNYNQAVQGTPLRVTVNLMAANYDLGRGVVVATLYSLLQPTQYYGIGASVVSASAVVPDMKAGQRYPVTLSLQVPASLAPGIYGVDIKANYTTGPGNMVPGAWPRGIHFKQAAAVQVVPSLPLPAR